jgi:prepilin-type N-terminal cleavage/methylation domain-containing protein
MQTTIDSTDTRTSDKGFTLVELLIVIVILGILATVTVFAVRGITDQGKTSTCAGDKRTLEVAVEAYYAKFNANPTEAQLVSGGFIKAASPNYDISGANVVGQSGNSNGCS